MCFSGPWKVVSVGHLVRRAPFFFRSPSIRDRSSCTLTHCSIHPYLHCALSHPRCCCSCHVRCSTWAGGPFPRVQQVETASLAHCSSGKLWCMQAAAALFAASVGDLASLTSRIASRGWTAPTDGEVAAGKTSPPRGHTTGWHTTPPAPSVCTSGLHVSHPLGDTHTRVSRPSDLPGCSLTNCACSSRCSRIPRQRRHAAPCESRGIGLALTPVRTTHQGVDSLPLKPCSSPEPRPALSRKRYGGI